MNKIVFGIVAGVVAIGTVLFMLIANSQKAESPSVSTADQSASSAQSNASNDSAVAPQATASNQQPVADQETADVTIQNYAYAPQKITIKAGTTVTWTNQDSVKHDVMADDENDDFRGSELLGKGQSYSFTFTKPGTYTYFCSPHPYMKGTVEVTE